LSNGLRSNTLLAKRLYVVTSVPTNGGPLADDTEQEWNGEGMFVYRAPSRDDAVKLAEADPMHASGARSFTVRLWMLNEGTFSVRLFYSGGRPEVI
jgi:hypothetical protein